MIVQPKPSLAKPYQIKAIERMAMMGRVLLADPPGAGKSLMTLGALNQASCFDSLRVLIVCPASIKFVWETEIEKWVIPPSTVDVISGVTGKKGTSQQFAGHEPDMPVDTFPIHFSIVNYDIVIKPPVRQALRKEKWDYIIFDEAHALKTLDSKRSKVCLGVDGRTVPLIAGARNIIAITGTPLNNHVVDLFPLCSTLAPEEFPPNFERFAARYCDPRPTDYGYDYTGADNLEELNDKLRRSCMIRRKKEVILPDLPAKQFATVMIDGAKSLLKKEEKALKEAGMLELKDDFKGVERMEILLDTLATVRRELSMEKIKFAFPLIKNWLESTDEKLVIMGYHKEALETLHKMISGIKGLKAVLLTGSTSQTGRKEAVDRFQTEKACRVFIGNIAAAGTGITLTAARTMFFVELDWNPSSMLQAVDRIHRIGQEHKVLVQFLCFRHSLEAAIAKSLEKKSQRIETAIDRGSEAAAIADMTQ